ncbi:type I restriction enzyme EcoEI R protein [Actinobacillus pleuropneumoniae]|nr:type I restriction enzyme EcoEI R protein [Actinobacillus pleuropneumoniae]
MPMTKQERIEKAKKSDYLAQYSEENRQVLGLLLDEYVKSGTKDLSKTELLQTPKFRTFGGLLPILNKFGGQRTLSKSGKRLRKNYLF